jgi:hypothetical protein
MAGLVPAIHVFNSRHEEVWVAGHKRAEAMPSFRRPGPGMTVFEDRVTQCALEFAAGPWSQTGIFESPGAFRPARFPLKQN